MHSGADRTGRFPHLSLELPAWVEEELPAADHVFANDEDRMRLALALARRNIAEGTGGPFGAAIFNGDTGQLVAPGVNLVATAQWSGAHAEMVAFAIAQKVVGAFDLGGEGMPSMELFTSTEPCAMCLGATFWTGVRRVVCAARGADAEAIGFDEGPKPDNWPHELVRRGIAVTLDLLRDEGAQVLRDYASGGGLMYNSRQGDSGE